MQILFFTEISPFPINGGERIRSYGLLKALSNIGANVTAVIRNENNIDLNKYQIKNINFISFEKADTTFLSNLFFTNIYATNKNILQIFDSLLEINNYDLVFLDYLFSGRYISYFKKRNLPVIIGTHNCESSLFLQEPAPGFFKKVRRFQLYTTMKLHENIFFKKADALITVSDNDKNQFSNRNCNKSIFVIPNFLDFDKYNHTQNYKRENYFVMTANYNAYMNVEGLKWLLNDVWDYEIDKNSKLLIVGKNSDKILDDIGLSSKFENVLAVGPVEDVNPYISKSKAVLIPLLQGSGSRLKCLEAMALKTPIIATPKGVEGIESEFFLVANTAQELKNKILNYKLDKKIGDNLQKDFINNYSLRANTKKIKDIINYVLKK